MLWTQLSQEWKNKEIVSCFYIILLAPYCQLFRHNVPLIFFQKFYFSQRFLLRRALEVIVGTNLVLALMQQWIVPGIVNSLIPFSVSILFRRVYIVDYAFILYNNQMNTIMIWKKYVSIFLGHEYRKSSWADIKTCSKY